MSTWLERRRIRARAGSSAQQRYRRFIHEWRRGKRRFFVTFGVAAFGIYIVLIILSREHLWIFFAGVFAGSLVALFIAAFGSPPAWVENYQLGAWGERRTAKALMPLLKDGWIVIHDISRWKSNLDHVLIGPAGIFVLDTKNYNGTITVTRDNLTVAHGPESPVRTFGDRLARQCRAQGAELHDVLRRRGHDRLWVSAVVVFWSEFPQQSVVGDRVTYVHGDALVSWLRSQPKKLTPERIADVAGALRSGQRRAPTTS